MALIKNEIPILEYDTDSMAVIMPGHQWDYKFSEKAVMLFMEPEIEDFIGVHECKIVGKFESVTKLLQAPLGGAGAVQIMEQLIGGGAKQIIAAGCCGALIDDAEGDFFIPTVALRQEGASYHYLPPAREIELDEKPVIAIEKALTWKGFHYRKCKTWTTDGFYRETKEMVLYRKEEGYSVVEMECASLAACARRRGVLFGQILFTADTLANVEKYDIRNQGNDTFAVALELAMDAVTEL